MLSVLSFLLLTHLLFGGLSTAEVEVQVKNKVEGSSMQLVGYNQGYFLPGSNSCDWVEWSQVNALRVWTDENLFASSCLPIADGAIADLADFERFKDRLRKNPEGDEFFNWKSVGKILKSRSSYGNIQCLDYELTCLRNLGVKPLIEINGLNFGTSWSEHFELWRRYYIQAFCLARNYGVTMFSMINEPNHPHAGPVRPEVYVQALRFISDAVHCAVDDVNRLYGTQLQCLFVGPVTSGYKKDWFKAVAAAEGTDYKGDPAGRELIDIHSINSYNRTAEQYKGQVPEMMACMSEAHPAKKIKPFMYTEIGRWMNSLLINRPETMDSPSLFSEWAAIYAMQMHEGCYGMYAFKMVDTRTVTYPRGVKSGHHYSWKGERVLEDACTNLALGCPVTVNGGSGSQTVVDGDKSDGSAWKMEGDGEKWCEIHLGSRKQIYGAAVYTGSSYGVYTGPDRVKSSRLQAFCNGEWFTIPETVEDNNKYVHSLYVFPQGVETDRIRYRTDDFKVIVREIRLFDKKILDRKEDFSITEPSRAAHVVRLFAKGFKGSRPLLKCVSADSLSGLHFSASRSQDGTVNLWVACNGNAPVRLKVDLSELGMDGRQDISMESVSKDQYSQAAVLRTDASGSLHFTAAPYSVHLLTIVPYHKKSVIPAKEAVSLRLDGTAVSGNRGLVSMNASDVRNNVVTVMRFQGPDVQELSSAARVLLSVTGRSSDRCPYKFHVYLYRQEGNVEPLSHLEWTEVPFLDVERPHVWNGDGQADFAGEFMYSGKERKMIDLTDVVKRGSGETVDFLLVREAVHTGDDLDKGRSAQVVLSGPAQPELIVWK